MIILAALQIRSVTDYIQVLVTAIANASMTILLSVQGTESGVHQVLAMNTTVLAMALTTDVSQTNLAIQKSTPARQTAVLHQRAIPKRLTLRSTHATLMVLVTNVTSAPLHAS